MATTKKKGSRNSKRAAGKAAASAVEAATAAPRKPRKSKARARATAKPAAPARRSASARRSSAPAAEIRRAEVVRETSETRISVRLAIGEPGYRIETGVPFLDHMLEALSRHSGIGLAIEASGDTHIDDHHTVEDVGLAIGEALRRALGDKAGIYRFGHFEAPLDEALVAVTVDLSGRPYLVYNVGLKPQRVGTFDVGLVEDFFQALMTTAGMNLHVNVRYGRNPHHIIEAAFKAFAKAIRMACAVDVATDGVPSTKGSL
jgi:imidazoleglycerol-phosphate dehydratase